MKAPYFLKESCKCDAYVQEISYFFFWRRWYWRASFYNHEDFLPCDVFDGFEKTEADAIHAIHERYEEQIPECPDNG